MLLNHVTMRRALSIVTMLALAGCGLDGLFGNDGGRVRIAVSRDDGGNANLVTDTVLLADRDDDDDDDDKRGFFRFQTATVELSSILARTNDGELVDLDIDLPIVVDVVRLDRGAQLVLPDGFLPFGTYDQIVFVITAVQGVTHDGTVVTIEPPGGGWTAVVPICPLDVVEGQTAVVGLALNVRSSFLEVGNWWSFHPRFRSLGDCDDD